MRKLTNITKGISKRPAEEDATPLGKRTKLNINATIKSAIAPIYTMSNPDDDKDKNFYFILFEDFKYIFSINS